MKCDFSKVALTIKTTMNINKYDAMTLQEMQKQCQIKLYRIRLRRVPFLDISLG